MSLLDITQIMQILPHRYPMLMIDEVIECDDKTRVVAIKNLTVNEPYFAGHFPGHPVMPGVLQIEAMAQTGGILMNRLFKKSGAVAYFLTIDNAKFRRLAQPGDTLRIEVVFQKARMGVSKVHGRITVGEDLISEADLMFSYAEK